MQHVIIGSLVAFFISFYSIPVIIFIAKAKRLYDIPDDRKVHASPVPLLGGLGIFAGFILGLLLNINITDAFSQFQYFIASFFIVFFLGLGDDIMVLSPLKKFFGQLVVAFILIFKGNLLINDLHGFLGIGALNDITSYLLTFFTILVVVNAFNLIDGVDGLAGSLGLITSLFLGVWFLINNDTAFALIGFALAGSVTAFLIYNFNPAKIFMGDAGSMLLGLINSILVIHFISTAPTAANLGTIASPAIGFGLLLIPLMDTLRVFCIRIFKGRSPFSADRNHIHHLFLDRGFSHASTTLVIASLSILFSALSFAIATTMPVTLVVATQVTCFFTAIYLIYSIKPLLQLHVVKKEGNVTIQEKKKPLLISIFYRKESAAALEEE